MNLLLEACLEAQAVRTLEAISRARGFPFSSHRPKAESVRRLAGRLLESGAMEAAWAGLSDPARGALRELARRDAPMRREDFIHRYGLYRPHKPWRKELPRRPWLDPISPAERLIYTGLVYPLNLGTTARPVLVIALPDEVRAALLERLDLPDKVEPLPSGRSPFRRPIDRQVFALLSYLNTHDVRPLWGRWLPPTVARRLIRWLALSPLEGASIRSELQAPRLAFLHYLAERAGLLSPTGTRGCLKPTLRVRDWMGASHAGRMQTLWEAWLSRDEAAELLWRRFRLPAVGQDDPLSRLCGMLCALPPLLVGGPLPLDALLDELGRYDPLLFRSQGAYCDWADWSDEAQGEYRGRVRECLADLLAGPVAWFGVVEVTGAKEDAGGSRLVGLTPLGASLCSSEATVETTLPDPSAGEGASEGWLDLEVTEEQTAIAVRVLPSAPLPALWTLEELADAVEGDARRYILSRGSLLRALDRGHTVEGIVSQLERDGGDALSPAVLHLLYTWAEAHGAIRIGRAMILQTRDPELLRELGAAKRVREKFTATLSARAVTVDGAAVDLLVRQIERRGLHVTVERRFDGSVLRAEEISSADRVAMVAALRLAQELAHQVGMRLHMPYPLLQDWEAALTLEERDAAKGWANRVLERVPRRLWRAQDDYRPPFPVAPLMPALEEAIAGGKTVEIEYHAFDRPVTVRRIDPLRLEQWGKGGKDYVVAFCHLRGEERTFRVDRIGRMEDC